MTKEVTNKKNNEVGEALDMSEWGGSPITSQDITLPRILVMQATSEAVTEGKAAFGELRESLNNTKLGDFKTPLEVVPFFLQKVFVEYDVTAGDSWKDKRFLRMTPITPENDDLPFTDEEKTSEGKTIKISRDRCMNYFVLLPEEMDNGTALPYVLSFRRTSLKAGKKLATQMYIKNKDANKPPPAVMCEISSNRQSNDDGTYSVLDVKFTTPTPSEYIDQCKKWIKTILAGQAKIHEESFQEEEKQASPRKETSEPDVHAEPGDY